MNCPGCGGSLKPVGNRNHLQCGHCARFHFPEASRDGLVLTDEQGELLCPVCPEQLMDGALLEGQPAHWCPACRGVLSELASFSRAVSYRRSQRKIGTSQPEMFDASELRRGIKCPQCRQRMENYPYAGGGNAVVDACHGCQLIWLDAGELEVIASHVPAPSPRSTYLPPSPVNEDEGLWSLLMS